MQSLRDPKWIFLVNTGPMAVLLALGYGEFSVIRTLLTPECVALWQLYGAALALLATGVAAYAAVQLARHRPVGAAVSLGVLLSYSALLCLLMTQASEFIPWEIPRWMVPTDPILVAWTFGMPTLAYALLVLVARFTPDHRPHQVAPSVGMAVAVPVGWAVLFGLLQAVTGFLPWPAVATAIFVAALAVSTLSFFFFLVRAVYIASMRRAGFWLSSAPIWKGIVTIALPLAGLGLNNGVFFGRGFAGSDGIFGDFSSPWFYGLAVLNGALLCVPNPDRPALRLLLLAGRSVLFGYTFYFFLVFLPFLPLSIPAIILIGTGFLLLAPTLLFVVHVRQLGDDVTDLRASFSKLAVCATLVAGVAVLPLVVTADYWRSRRTLHEALAYVYTPNYAASARLDAPALVRTLATIKQHKERGRDMFSGSQLPYLSLYFNWLVLDNLMLSDAKIVNLERVFSSSAVDPAAYPARWTPPAPTLDALRTAGGPQLRALTATSTYDARQQAWVSWVSLEIANPDTAQRTGEYSSQFTLPPGCWVSDYYLTIGNRQERGILAEKRAATWVFAQILNEHQNRDPGLLNYQGPNEVAVRVFPVVGREVRRTRIQLLHKEPCRFTLDGRSVALGTSGPDAALATPVATPDGGVVYLSAAAKKSLPLVQRRPYYHFLLDASAARRDPAAAYETRLRQQLAQALPGGAAARFSLVDAYTTPVAAGTDWQLALRQHAATGGFYLTGAIRRVLFEAQQRPTSTYPVLVVVSDNLPNAVLDQDFVDFSSAYPESDVFYELSADGRLVPHSLRHNARQPLGPAAAPTTLATLVSAVPTPAASVPVPAAAVRAWPNAAHPRIYLPDTDQADIVLAAVPAVSAATAAPESRWLAGLRLHGCDQWQHFHPETADRNQVRLVQASFRAGIMTSLTSFLALENEAQKAALFRKQEETLAANVSLDTLEEPDTKPVETPIDGGVLLLVVVGAGLGAWYLRRGAASGNFARS